MFYLSQYANLNLTWKSLYVTQPVSEGNSWLQFRVEYAWGSPNKTNRTIKLYTRLWLDKSKYYLQVDNTSANRSNQLRGINVGINIRGNTKGKTYKVNDYGHSPRCQLVDNNDNDNYSPYIVRCKSIWETYDNTVQWTRTDALMCELDYELSYDDNGSASGTILYDLYLRWKDIDTYGIHCLDARSARGRRKALRGESGGTPLRSQPRSSAEGSDSARAPGVPDVVRAAEAPLARPLNRRRARLP